MVAFKEEFPYLRCDSGQLFEFDRAWLHAAITRAADQAGYPSWWLTDHVTESIAFYLRLRNDEPVVAFSQLSQTVRYVLKVIGYKEINKQGRVTNSPFSISWKKESALCSVSAPIACASADCTPASNICKARKDGRADATGCARKWFALSGRNWPRTLSSKS